LSYIFVSETEKSSPKDADFSGFPIKPALTPPPKPIEFLIKQIKDKFSLFFKKPYSTSLGGGVGRNSARAIASAHVPIVEYF